MARSVIEKATCDFCGKSADESFTISNDGLTVLLDACKEHEKPYVKAMEIGTAEGRKRTDTHGGPVKAHAVIPVD